MRADSDRAGPDERSQHLRADDQLSLLVTRGPGRLGRPGQVVDLELHFGDEVVDLGISLAEDLAPLEGFAEDLPSFSCVAGFPAGPGDLGHELTPREIGGRFMAIPRARSNVLRDGSASPSVDSVRAIVARGTTARSGQVASLPLDQRRGIAIRPSREGRPRRGRAWPRPSAISARIGPHARARRRPASDRRPIVRRCFIARFALDTQPDLGSPSPSHPRSRRPSPVPPRCP